MTTPVTPFRFALIAGALMAALSVGLGAFGAHALKGVLSPSEATTFATATRYLGYHGLGLLLVATLTRQWVSLCAVTLLLTVGVGIFSGSLYILCLTELRWVAWLTPLGGLLMLAGWLWLAWIGFRQAR
ncbi:DUF423 domain-containing protein [Motiliproteus sediminis]|uniref:DUF423 domain-containing protein n=1 Tax=Motiliproteus sediminis TaxID=1468178 RepID=UPI001AEFE42B|nr:DUF423 domain-containing protein [Motiliproteus sediminis]